MRQVGIVGLLVCVIIVGLTVLSYFLLGKTNVSTQPIQKSLTFPPTALPTPPETPIPEVLPPLYRDALWGVPNTDSPTGQSSKPDASDITTLGQRADNFYYIVSQPFDVTKRQSAVNYYETWFEQHGWKEDIIADGPTGSAIGFVKNGNRFLVNFSYIPHSFDFYTIIVEHN